MNMDIIRAGREITENLTALSELIEQGDEDAARVLVDLANAAALRVKHFSNRPADSLARTAMDLCARVSDYWPLSMPSIKELREVELRNSMPDILGSSLPEKMHPMPGKGGTRQLDESSKSGFALSVLNALRSNSLPIGFEGHHENELANEGVQIAMRGLFTEYQSALAWSKIEGAGLAENFTDELRAESLAKFGNVFDLAKSMPPLSKESLSGWVDIAMAWADAACAGRWESYPWPEKIRNRAATNTSKYAVANRGHQTIVREWIQGGLATLIGRP